MADKMQKISIEDDKGIEIGKLEFYDIDEKVICVTHTNVDPKMQGLGFGDKLVEELISYVSKNNKKVVARCSFVEKKMLSDNRYKKFLIKRSS